MKTNEFFEIMGSIDASLIERADKTATKRHVFSRLAAVAAVFALLVTGMLVVLPMFREDENLPDDNIIGDALVWSNVFGLFDPNMGSGVNEGGMTVLVESSFSEIETKKYANYDLGYAFPLDKNDEFFGGKLDEIKVRTGWRWYDDTETDVVTVKAEVYEIRGVSTAAAVAVKYLEKGTSTTTEHFYAALNTEYEFTTLAAFLSDFNAAAHIDISEKDALVTAYPRFGSDQIDKYRFADGGGADIIKYLLTLDAEAEALRSNDVVDGRMNNCGEIRRVTFSMASAGKMTNMLYIFDNGYIAIQGKICNGIVFFNVGGEATSELFEIFKANTELVTIINSGSHGDGLVEETTSAPQNEVVPE